MIGTTLHKGSYGEAYVAATAAGAGFAVAKPSTDTGVDWSIMSGRHPEFPSDPKIDVQVKTSHNGYLDGDEVVFEIEVEDYRKLIKRSQTPRILVGVIVPFKEQFWVRASHAHLLLRRCAYWVNLSNWPDTTNSSTLTLRWSKHQVFSPKQLVDMMRRVENGEAP